MHDITIVCSVHRENGHCSVEELLKTLEEIQPDVVFEEVRPADFDATSTHGVNGRLEALAIRKYVLGHTARRVPVDRYDLPLDLLASYKNTLDFIFDFVEHTSQEYQALSVECARNTSQLGFHYLNSHHFKSAQARLCEIEDLTVAATGDAGAIQALKFWREHVRGRERGMVDAIYDFCATNEFAKGALLVGAAHGAEIEKEARKPTRDSLVSINWKSYEGLAPTTPNGPRS